MLKEGAPFGPHRAFPPGLYSNSCGPGTKQYREIVEYCNKGVRRKSGAMLQVTMNGLKRERQIF